MAGFDLRKASLDDLTGWLGNATIDSINYNIGMAEIQRRQTKAQIRLGGGLRFANPPYGLRAFLRIGSRSTVVSIRIRRPTPRLQSRRFRSHGVLLTS